MAPAIADADDDCCHACLLRADPLNREVEEVRCTGDARVVVADRLLEYPGKFIVGELQRVLEHHPEVILDGQLVLRRWRNNLCLEDAAVAAEPVAVI